MQAIAQIATLLIQTLASLFLFFVVMRFLLQLARADFYNPLSQAVVKLTNPALIPLRKLIPGLFGIDLASVVLAVLVGFAAIELNVIAVGGGFLNPITALLWAIIGVLSLARWVIFIGMIVVIVASFIAPYSSHPALSLVNQLMEPIRRPFSRLLPPMGGLDLSPILIFLTLGVVDILLQAAAVQVGLGSQSAMFVPGY